jgi:hypothetical protein
MTTVYQQYLGRFYINSSLDSLTVDGTALTLTNGYYFTAGYTGESSEQLVEHLQTKIRTVAGQATATVTYSGSTGVVTISLDSAVTITFNDSGLAAYLGFSSASQTGSDEYTSDQIPRGVWRPTLGASSHPNIIENFWAKRSSTRVIRSADGVTYNVVGNEFSDAVIEYAILPEADVVTPDTGTIYRDFENWLSDIVHEGQPIRCYPDRTVNTATDYVTAIFGDDDTEMIGSFADYFQRFRSDYNGQWGVTLPLMEYNT